MINFKTQQASPTHTLQNHFTTSSNNHKAPLLMRNIKNHYSESTIQTATTMTSMQSPLSQNFRVGLITHQSSPYNKYPLSFTSSQPPQWTLSQQQQHQHNYDDNDDDNDDDDCDKPKVFQVEAEDISTTTMSSTSKLMYQTNNLDISSPTNKSANESFLSSQTKSSLKTSLSTNSYATSTTTSSKEVKHVKFKSDHHYKAAESPIMFSRSSSLTSLNSFDAKSVHSSLASEYSRRPSGIMSPSDLPDSPDGNFILQKQRQQQEQQQQQQQQLEYMESTSRRSLNYEQSRSNEITIVERTILGGTGNSNSNSEKNSFYCANSSISGHTVDSSNKVTKYNVENSPWRSEQHSADVSNLSAPTFDDDLSDNNQTSRDELNAIFSLLKTRTQNSAVTTKPNDLKTFNHINNNSNNKFPVAFTPPIKLSAIKESNSNNIQLDDIPISYCDENTPGNISPHSSISELSVPSLIRQEINQPQQPFKNFNISLLFTKLNLSTSLIHEIPNDSDEIPKVYDTEDHNETTKADEDYLKANKTNESIVDTDSPKVYRNEDTPMCYSRFSSMGSLNNDDQPKQYKNVKNGPNNGDSVDDSVTDGDKLNKSSILLSDSCHKPTNTPAGFGNMSRASYDSVSSSSDSDNEDGNLDNVEEEDEQSIEDEDKNKNVLKNFLNHALNDKGKKTNNNQVTNEDFKHEIQSNSDLKPNEDELLLQNFIKEMLPAPTRKSMSKLPVYNKRLSVNESTQQHVEAKKQHIEVENNKTCKKRLSEDAVVNKPPVHLHIRQQSNVKDNKLNIKNKKSIISQATSTYSLSSISGLNVTHHIPNHVSGLAPVVNMTKTTQLRVSKLAEIKSQQRKPMVNTNKTSSSLTRLSKPAHLTNTITNKQLKPHITASDQSRRKSFHAISTTTTASSTTTTTLTTTITANTPSSLTKSKYLISRNHISNENFPSINKQKTVDVMNSNKQQQQQQQSQSIKKTQFKVVNK